MRFLALLLVSLLASSCTTSSGSGSQEIDWFKSGFYTGAMYGASELDSSGADIDAELAKRGYMSTTDFDGEDKAANFYVGYRFEAPIGIELGYVNLGRVESFVAAMPPDINAFVDDVAEIHPVLGEGFQLQGRWFAWSRNRFEVSLGAGFWVWDADVDVRAGTGQEVDLEADDFDLTYGVAATYEVFDRWDLRVAWDRYTLDEETADALTFGIQVGLMGSSRSGSRDRNSTVAIY